MPHTQILMEVCEVRILTALHAELQSPACLRSAITSQPQAMCSTIGSELVIKFKQDCEADANAARCVPKLWAGQRASQSGSSNTRTQHCLLSLLPKHVWNEPNGVGPMLLKRARHVEHR